MFIEKAEYKVYPYTFKGGIKMNKVLLTGRLTRDAEVRRNEAGEITVARGTIAVDDRPLKDGTKVTHFPNIVAFGRQATFLDNYGKQGVKFEVEGRIITGSYTNKEGAKVYTTEVAVESIRFAESKGSRAASTETSAEAPVENPSSGITTDADGFMSVDDDFELPFN